jgi:hypothetical protein
MLPRGKGRYHAVTVLEYMEVLVEWDVGKGRGTAN